MKEEIAATYDDRQFVGGMTYNGHPVSLAAALANIEVIEQEGLLENAAQRGETLKALLVELKEKHPCVGDVRSIGLFGAAELVRDRGSKEPLSPGAKPLSPVMKRVKNYILEHGVFMYNTFHTLLFIPPLIITDAQLREGFQVVDAALSMADHDIEIGLE